MINQLTVKLPKTLAQTYSIQIDQGLLGRPEAWLPQDLSFSKAVIVTDGHVQKRYANRLAAVLKQLGYPVYIVAIPAGEKSKNAITKAYVEEKMLRYRCGRDTLILALGGGVVGDLAGFVAATYMRGIPYIQLPTTLLAMVDSSVGGKTSINHARGKNLIGAFWQPTAVVADTDCLKSLPLKHRVNGLVEALKMFLTSDADSFYFAEKNIKKILSGDEKILNRIIYQAVKIKSDIVSEDSQEKNKRMILNLGHTIAHSLERMTHYKILHGHAVGLGILVEAKIAELMGILSKEYYLLIEETFSRLGITTKELKKYHPNKIIQHTRLDKKNKSGQVRYVLLKDIGEVYINKTKYAHQVDNHIIQQALKR